MIKIHDYKPNSPEWVMANFFDCWQKRRWMQILNYVQPSWLAQYKEPNKVLRMSLYMLVDTKFIQMNANTGVVAVFLVDIHTKSHTFNNWSQRTIRLVREGRKWGIDPKSIM